MIIERKVGAGYIERNSVSFKKADVDAILSNKAKGINVFYAETGAFAFGIPKQNLSKLNFIKRPGYDGPYFTALVSGLTQNNPITVEIESEFMTQAEIARHYKIHQCRIAILVDCAWLKHSHKDGKAFMYRRTDVMGLINNPTFMTWLNNQHERNVNV